MRHVHTDGAGHRVAGEQQSDPLLWNELCQRGFAFSIPDACDPRDSSEGNLQEIFSGVARSRQ